MENNHEYVIESIADGRHCILRERIWKGKQLSLPLYQNQYLTNVVQYANDKGLDIQAIGSSYEIIR